MKTNTRCVLVCGSCNRVKFVIYKHCKDMAEQLGIRKDPSHYWCACNQPRDQHVIEGLFGLRQDKI
eukprot:3699221-Amphidinium_carterae.1